LGLACLGCLLLSLSLRRHYRQVFADPAGYDRRFRLLRVAGYACVALALWPCVHAVGLAMGVVLWASIAALAAVLQIVVLTYHPRGTAAVGCLGAALVALGLLL
jgi:hypothetical protein